MALQDQTEPRTRLDNWQHRVRPAADTTVGYTRFVRIMKVMLPLVAFSLIVLVIVYSTQRHDNIRFEIPTVGEVDHDRQLVKPRLTGTDGRGQPFTVTAQGATQAPGKVQMLTIDEVTADITMQDKSWVQVGAVKGLLDVKGKKLDLVDSINIYSDKGYECHTDKAQYDFGGGLLKGDSPIRCQGPMGVFEAKRFEGLRDPGIMRFMGGVTTTYMPSARVGEAAKAVESNPDGIGTITTDEPISPSDAIPPPLEKPKFPIPSATSPSTDTAPVQPKAKPTP